MTDALTPTDQVAVRVRTLRQQRGYTVKELAARCRDLGAEISTSVLTNLELGRREGGGRRRVAIEELLVLAAALDAPPVELLRPSADDQLAVTPDLAVDAERLVLWFAGERSATGLPTVGFEREAAAMRRYRAAHDAHQAAKDADRSARLARKDGEDGEAEQHAQERDRHLRALAGVADSLIEAGMRPPTINPGWARMMIRRNWFRYPDRMPVEEEDGAT